MYIRLSILFIIFLNIGVNYAQSTAVSNSPIVQKDSTFGVKYSGRECESILDFQEELTTVGNSISIKEGKVILEYHNSSRVRDIFTNPKDGIAIDLLNANQFLCGIENIKSPNPIFEGVMLEPVYRKKLVNGNLANNKNRYVAVVGVIPEHLKNENLVPAMIIIKNGVACYWSSPVKIPHKTFDPIPVVLKTNQEPSIPFREQGIVSSKQVFFQFARNITTTKIHDVIPKSKNPIHSIEITSFSSIEGDSVKNNLLHTGRAEFMKSTILKTCQTATIKMDAAENWEKCLYQLEILGMEPVTKLTHDSIRRVLYLDKKNNWDSLFHTQRKSNATIYYEGQFDRKNGSNFLTMNLRTALIEKNIPLARKALDSLYKANINCGYLFEENTITTLFNFPELVANTCAVLSLTKNYKSETLIRYVRYWLLNSQNLDALAKQNLIYLYSITSDQLLDKWDVESSKFVKVLHPSRADKVISTIEAVCPSVILLDYNIGTIEFYSQLNEYSAIQKKFEYIEEYFRTKKSTMKELEQLALFYNHWGCFDMTLNVLYKQIDNPEFSKVCALVLAQTAAATGYGKSTKVNYMKIMKKAQEKNPQLFCMWVSEAFNVLSHKELKTFYCEKCGDKK
jgi:hypothetical protein